MEAVRLFLSEAAREKLAVISFPDLVELFLVHIREKKKSRRYVLDMQARLHFAAKTFTANIADIKTAEMDKWLASMKKNTSRTKNNYRKAIRTLFRFGREKNYLPREAKTEAEFTTSYDLGSEEIGIYTPEQLEILLSRLSPRMLPFLAIGAFAGLRTAEISRLEWQHVRFEQNVIAVPASVAKTANRRLAPILPVLAAWLKPFRKPAGKVLESVRDEFALAALFKQAVDAIKGEDGNPLLKIVHNGLRHSYISYRVADIKNVAEVALESGNSPRIIFSSYRELVMEEEAKKWFAIMPAKERLKEIHAAIADGL